MLMLNVMHLKFFGYLLECSLGPDALYINVYSYIGRKKERSYPLEELESLLLTSVQCKGLKD